jgi:hypothetical protein
MKRRADCLDVADAAPLLSRVPFGDGQVAAPRGPAVPGECAGGIGGEPEEERWRDKGAEPGSDVMRREKPPWSRTPPPPPLVLDWRPAGPSV